MPDSEFGPGIGQQRGGKRMDPCQARRDLDAAAFQTAFNQLAAGGYRLVDISDYMSGATPRYAGI